MTERKKWQDLTITDDYMTYLMKLDEERENERADIIANMLKEHTSLEFIMKVCNTSMEFIKEVAKQRGLALDY